MYSPTLILGQTPFEAMGKHFNAETAQFNYNHLLILVLVVAVLVAAVWVLSRWKQMEVLASQDDDGRLFQELCRGHQLGTRQIRLLRHVTRQGKFGNPALLFVDSHLLEESLQSKSLDGHHGDIERIGQFLFGSQWNQSIRKHPDRKNGPG